MERDNLGRVLEYREITPEYVATLTATEPGETPWFGAGMYDDVLGCYVVRREGGTVYMTRAALEREVGSLGAG